jgi:hypothetical protein
MPRRDSAEASGALWWPGARRSAASRRARRGLRLTAGLTGCLLVSLAGISSGSGSARLGPSQKGDLPSSGERLALLVQGRRRAHTGEPLGIQLPRRLTEKVSQESVTSEPNNGSQDNHGGANYRGEGNKGRGE